jgi:hypothetical protein
MNTVRVLDRVVEDYHPPKLYDSAWLDELTPLERTTANALLRARNALAGEADQREVDEALIQLRFRSPGARGEDAVRRLRMREPLSAGDWDALSDCVKTRIECEDRESDAGKWGTGA